MTGVTREIAAKRAAIEAVDVNWSEAHADSSRKGDWMQTFTRKAFWPLDPRADEVDIEDIAHALSNVCRYTGHVSKFYSVAEHSVYVSLYVPPQYALWGLLHDASEAYIADIARPVKRHLTQYAEIEQGIMRVVAAHFGLPWPEPPEVKEIDNRILRDEKAMLMPGHPPRPWGVDHLEPLGVYIVGFSPEAAKSLFLTRFREITE